MWRLLPQPSPLFVLDNNLHCWSIRHNQTPCTTSNRHRSDCRILGYEINQQPSTVEYRNWRKSQTSMALLGLFQSLHWRTYQHNDYFYVNILCGRPRPDNLFMKSSSAILPSFSMHVRIVWVDRLQSLIIADLQPCSTPSWSRFYHKRWISLISYWP